MNQQGQKEVFNRHTFRLSLEERAQEVFLWSDLRKMRMYQKKTTCLQGIKAKLYSEIRITNAVVSHAIQKETFNPT